MNCTLSKFLLIAEGEEEKAGEGREGEGEREGGKSTSCSLFTEF